MNVISGDKVIACESSEDGFHDFEVIEITEVKRGNTERVYILLQCSWCKQCYDGNLHKSK